LIVVHLVFGVIIKYMFVRKMKAWYKVEGALVGLNICTSLHICSVVC